MGDKPGVLISGAARFDFLKRFANGVALVDFERYFRSQSSGAMRHVARGSFGQYETKRGDVPSAVRLAGAIQPEQRKRQAALDCVRGLTIRYGKDREVGRATSQESTNIIAGNRVLKIG
jgi:hypothetical protein